MGGGGGGGAFKSVGFRGFREDVLSGRTYVADRLQTAGASSLMVSASTAFSVRVRA